jgi:hypothetical protein
MEQRLTLRYLHAKKVARLSHIAHMIGALERAVPEIKNIVRIGLLRFPARQPWFRPPDLAYVINRRGDAAIPSRTVPS